MLKKIFKIIFYVIFAITFIIAIQQLLSGGIDEYSVMVEEEGFGGFLKEFFVSIWDGLKDLFKK